MSSRVRSPDLASDMRTKLRAVGLRPTRTRVALSSLLFAKGDRHLTAEMLFEEATRAKVSVSLATIYNSLLVLLCHKSRCLFRVASRAAWATR